MMRTLATVRRSRIRLAAAAVAAALYGATYLAWQRPESDARVLIGEAIAFSVAIVTLVVTLAPRRSVRLAALLAGLSGAFIVGMCVDNLVSSCILTPWSFVVGGAVSVSQVLSSPELAASGIFACTQFAGNVGTLYRSARVPVRVRTVLTIVGVLFPLTVVAWVLPMEHRFYDRLSTCIIDGLPARHPQRRS